MTDNEKFEEVWEPDMEQDYINNPSVKSNWQPECGTLIAVTFTVLMGSLLIKFLVSQ